MLSITQGMQRAFLTTMDKLNFDRYDKNGDGVISYAEYQNYLEANKVNETARIQKRQSQEQNVKGFNLEQFDPQGSINFESNGGYNSKKLNIIA